MNFKMISRLEGYILFIELAAMVPSFLISVFLKETNAVKGFLITMAILAAVGIILVLQKPQDKKIFVADGFALTTIAWVLIAFFGGMPYYFSGSIQNFFDCFFEAMSGFTTTGGTILTDVEVLPKGILFWRCFTHWIGGMGVLVFLLAILPNSGNGYTMHILRAESSGPSVGKLVPKMRKSASILYMIYVALTSILVVLLCIGKMPIYDSLCAAMSTAGTGGFGILNSSIAEYNDFCQIIISVFMIIFGINFSIFYLILFGGIKSVLKDEELWVYLGIIAFAVISIFFNIASLYENRGDALQDSLFQVASIISTTGFSTTDYNNWPDFSRAILLLLMIVGSSAGSTGGGIKVSRFVILAKSLKSEISSMLHPQAVKVVRMRGKPIERKLLRTVSVYIIAAAVIVIFSTLVLLANGEGLLTAFSAVLACFSNVGPGFEKVGPASNFSFFNNFEKLLLSFNMLVGRLEIFPVLTLFSPSVWRGANKIAPRRQKNG